MGKVTDNGWSKPSDQIAQPSSIIMGPHLRQNSDETLKPKQPAPKPKPAGRPKE
jgi:hypothetical protein